MIGVKPVIDTLRVIVFSLVSDVDAVAIVVLKVKVALPCLA